MVLRGFIPETKIYRNMNSLGILRFFSYEKNEIIPSIQLPPPPNIVSAVCARQCTEKYLDDLFECGRIWDHGAHYRCTVEAEIKNDECQRTCLTA